MIKFTNIHILKVGVIIPKVTYKINIPFQFTIGNKFYGTHLTIKEFNIKDVNIKMFLDESEDKEYLIATTNISEDGVHDLEEIADKKVGTAVQSFFDGISKALSNAAFFSVYNGDKFTIPYEWYCDGLRITTPLNDRNKGYNLDDNIINVAIEFANLNNEYLKQAFLYLNEGEYLVDIGRYSNAIIQFAVMTEYLINYQLERKGMINKSGYLIGTYKDNCCKEWEAHGGKDKPSFVFSKYIYGLSNFNLRIEDELTSSIDDVYRLRNKLAHGHRIFEAFNKCKIEYDDEAINQYNIWDWMMYMSDSMTGVYNFFADNF